MDEFLAELLEAIHSFEGWSLGTPYVTTLNDAGYLTRDEGFVLDFRPKFEEAKKYLLRVQDA